MAIVTVQVAVTSISDGGEYDKKVCKGWETYSIHVKGEQITKKRLWTFWLESAATFTKGSIVEFTGELGSKASQLDKDGKTYNVVEHSINKARYTTIHQGEPNNTPTPNIFTGEPAF